jgi:hypothetical protein
MNSDNRIKPLEIIEYASAPQARRGLCMSGYSAGPLLGFLVHLFPTAIPAGDKIFRHSQTSKRNKALRDRPGKALSGLFHQHCW